MREHPWLVGGDEAVDTAAMRETSVVAKRGALGVVCCASAQTGLGGAIKAESGSDAAAEVAFGRLVELVAQAAAPTLEAAATRPLRDGAGAVVGAVARERRMSDLRFGPSGLPAGSPAEALATLAGYGFTACEVSFARRYPAKPLAAELGQLAREAGILLSVHAPMFAFPGNTDAAKRKQAASNMDHTAGLAKLIGAELVVIHPGFHLGRTPADAMRDVVDHLKEIEARLRAKDRLMPFGIEVMGRVRDLGTLDDVVSIARQVDWVRPVIDFAHLQATSDGALREASDFAEVLALARTALGPDERLHVHFSDIHYANRNEDRHLPYGEGDLRAEPLRDALAGFDRPVTVISESPNLESHLEIGRILGVVG